MKKGSIFVKEPEIETIERLKTELIYLEKEIDKIITKQKNT